MDSTTQLSTLELWVNPKLDCSPGDLSKRDTIRQYSAVLLVAESQTHLRLVCFPLLLHSATGKPSSLTLEHIMNLGTLTPPDYIMGLAFSNIATDPTTGFGLLFSFLGSEGGPMVTLPLLQRTDGFYDVDSANVQYLCTPDLVFSGSLDLIPVGNRANDYAVTDYSGGTLKLMDIDSSTGFPVGNPNPPLLSQLQTNITCPFVGTELVDLWVNEDPNLPANIWGSKFDIKGTGDYFASTWGDEEDSFIFVFHGFPPGYDVNVVSANLAATLDALLEDISANARKLMTDEEQTIVGPGRRAFSSNKNVVRKTKSDASGKGTKSPGKGKGTKSPGKGKGKKDSVPMPSAAPSESSAPSESAAPSVSSVPSVTPQSAGEQQTEATVEALADFGVEVTPALEAAIATATNPAGATSVQEAIATGTNSAELVQQMNDIDDLVDAIFPDTPTQFQVESATYIKCATNKIRNTGTPSLASAICVLPSPP